MDVTPLEPCEDPAGSVLHVGCGGDKLPDFAEGLREVRLDIDPATKPDIIADMVDMGQIGTFDMLVCMHALEHLYPHDVPKALGEFLRVLRPGGRAVIVVLDLEGVSPTDEIVFEAPCGPISGLDLFYGYRPALETMPHMAHHCGFVRATLEQAMHKAGFGVAIVKRLDCYNLLGVGVKA